MSDLPPLHIVSLVALTEAHTRLAEAVEALDVFATNRATLFVPEFTVLAVARGAADPGLHDQLGAYEDRAHAERVAEDIWRLLREAALRTERAYGEAAERVADATLKEELLETYARIGLSAAEGASAWEAGDE